MTLKAELRSKSSSAGVMEIGVGLSRPYAAHPASWECAREQPRAKTRSGVVGVEPVRVEGAHVLAPGYAPHHIKRIAQLATRVSVLGIANRWTGSGLLRKKEPH